MSMIQNALVPVAALTATLAAQTPQYQVVPAAYTTTDAISYEWIAGASRDLRQQTLIGASHLQGMVGHPIRAIELRRSAANEVYQGGTANLSVTLSTSPNVPLRCAATYQDNVGQDAVQVFSGTVTLPTSPAVVGATVPWTANNVVRIVFTTPFPYQGGTLLVDIVGQPVAGQNANWWMADAEFEDIKGTTVQVGSGCGAYGGPTHEWSHVAPRTLLPGAHARFWAYGPNNGLAVVVVGTASHSPIPLVSLGLPAPGCDMHLQPSSLLLAMAAVFEPEVNPLLQPFGGIAELRLHLPDDPWIFGMTLSTQWLDLMQPATSNAVEWTIASQMPSLDMALVEGSPLDTNGEVSVHLAQVMRFEYQ
jgi:hypothetical protein